MKFAATKENMEQLLSAFGEHIEEKMANYEELQERFPATAFVFEKKIKQAQKTLDFFPQILKEYF